MATPVLGPASHDEKYTKYLEETEYWNRFFSNGDGKNLSKVLMKRSALAHGIHQSYALNIATEKVEQTIGALKGQMIQRFNKLDATIRANTWNIEPQESHFISEPVDQSQD